MIETLDLLANDRPALARSLFLWQQILGESTTAAARLRGLVGPLVQLPLGADVTALNIPIQPNPTGFDVHSAALPAADTIFAFVSEPGLRLSCTVEKQPDGRNLRRLRVLNADGTQHRRQGEERFMLRYRLNPALFAAEHLAFLSITLESEPGPPPLHAWIEVDDGQARHFVVPEDSHSTMLAPGECARLLTFRPHVLTALPQTTETRTALLSIELTGDTINTPLLGEALLAV
jgi:hypothetical protein